MDSRLSNKKVLMMTLMGSTLETYDYTLYGYFAPLLAQLFFPELHPAAALLAAFSVFAVGFIARPLGAAFCGFYGDKYGRKKILLLSIMLMALPTAFIGMLPTYAQIGVSAGFLLVLFRLIQGFAVGAEFVGTMVYLIEQAPANKKTFYGSLCICSGFIAILFTSLMVTLLTHYLSNTALIAWGWRLPFLFGIVLGIVGLIIRAKLPETRPFRQLQQDKAIVSNPLMQTIKKMPFKLITGTLMVTLHVFGFYLLFFYMSSYYKIAPQMISLINTVVLIMAVMLIPCVGLLAEKINKKYFVAAGCMGFIVLAYPLFQLVNHPTLTAILVVQTTLTLFLCLNSAVIPSLLSELFPVSVRYTGMALCYNLCAVMFGGTAPLVLTYLSGRFSNSMMPCFCLMLAAGLTLLSLFMGGMPKIILKSLSYVNFGPIFVKSLMFFFNGKFLWIKSYLRQNRI